MAARNPHLNKSFRSLVSKRQAEDSSVDIFASGQAGAHSWSTWSKRLSTALSKRLFYCLHALLPAINTSGDAIAMVGCVWMAIQPLGMMPVYFLAFHTRTGTSAALALRPAKNLAWSDIYEMSTFGNILQASLLWPSSLGTALSYNLLKPAFGIGVSLVILHFGAFAIVSSQSLQPDLPSGAVFMLLKHISAFCRGIAFIPIVVWLLGPFLCDAEAGWAAEAECSSSSTTVAAIFGIVLVCAHLALSGIEAVTLVDQAPKGGLKAAISGRPMLTAQLLNCIAAIVTLFSTSNLSPIAGLATTLVISIVILVIIFFYQPFFNQGINLLFMSSAVWAIWVAFMRLISWDSGQFSQATALTAVVLLPVSWTIAYALQKWRFYNARTMPLAEIGSSADVRLKIAELMSVHVKLNIKEDSALDLAAEVLRFAAVKLRSSSSIHILHDNFLHFSRRNKYLEQSQIEHLVEKSTAIDNLFYAFRRRLELSEEQESSAHMGVAARIQFDRKQAEALQLSIRTRSKLLAFWVELADSKEPNVSEVHKLAGSLSEHVAQTRAAFENLVGLNPSHVGLLRQYAQFLLEVSNDVDRGHALLEEADSIEDTASRRHAQPHGSFSFMGKSSLDAADEGIGILTASAAPDSLGEVTSCNANALRMFGFGRREILGKNISALMPEPISSMHNALLQRYLQSGVEQVTGTTRVVFGLHRTHTIFPMFLHVKAMDVGFGALTMPFRTSEGFFMFSGRSATVSAACQRSLTTLRLSPEDVAAGQVSLTSICPNITSVIRAMSAAVKLPMVQQTYDRVESDSVDNQSVFSTATKLRADDTKQLMYVPTLFQIHHAEHAAANLPVSVRVTKHEFSFPRQTNFYVLQWHEADPARFHSAQKKPRAIIARESQPDDKLDSEPDSVAALLDEQKSQGSKENMQHELINPLAEQEATAQKPTLVQNKHQEDNYTLDSRSYVHSVRTTGSATSALTTLRRLVTQNEKALDPGLRMLRNAFAAIFALTVLVTSISSASVVSKLSAFADADDLLHSDASRQLKVMQIEGCVRSLDALSDQTLLHFPGDARKHPQLPPHLISTDSLLPLQSLSPTDQSLMQSALTLDLRQCNDELQKMSRNVFAQLSSDSFRSAHAESVNDVPSIIRLHSDQDLQLTVRRAAQVSSEKSSLIVATDRFVAAVNDVWTSFRLTNTSDSATSARDFIHDNFNEPIRTQQASSAELLETIQIASFSSLYSVPEQVFLVIAAIADIVLLAGVIPLIQRVELTNDRVVAAFLNVPQSYLQNLRQKCKVNLDKMVFSLAADGEEEIDEFDSQLDDDSGSEGEDSVGAKGLSDKNRHKMFGLGGNKLVQRASKKSQAAFFFLLIKFGGPLIALLAYLMVIYFWTFAALHNLQFSSSNIVLGYNRLLHLYAAGIRTTHAVQIPTWNDAYRQALNFTMQAAWQDVIACGEINRKLVFGDAVERREAEVLDSEVSRWMLESACTEVDQACQSFQNGAVKFNGLSNVLQRYLDDVKSVLIMKALEANHYTPFQSGILDLDLAVVKSLELAPGFSVEPTAMRCSMRDRAHKSFDNVLASHAASTGNSSWLALGALDPNATACKAYRRNWARVSPLPEIQTLQNSFLLSGLLEVLQIKSGEVRYTVDMYSVGMIVVTISMGILIFVFFLFAYVPLVHNMDQGMKRTRSLLLLFPEDALIYIPSLKKAMRSAALGATQGLSTRSLKSGLGSRLRRVRNASRVFPSRNASASASVTGVQEQASPLAQAT